MASNPDGQLSGDGAPSVGGAADGQDGGGHGFLPTPRLVDLARHAGVSMKTVSRVLNGEQYVSDAMRRRVLAAVEELGYVTDHRARVLRTNRSGFLGLIIPDIRNGFFAQLTQSLEKRLAPTGQMILLGISDEAPEKEERYLRLFRQQRIDGLVILPSGAPSLQDFSRRVPMVVLDRVHPAVRHHADHVLVNNRGAAETLTRHLTEQHALTQVCMVAGESAISSVQERGEGYAAAVAAAGLPHRETTGHTSAEEAAFGALAAFRKLEPPFGVFATGQRMYSGSMAALAQLGLRVPKDVLVTTFSGVGEASLSGLTPTQAVLPVPTMAARALQLLTERINSPARPFRDIHLDCDIEYGATCGCVGIGDLAATVRQVV